MKKTPNPIRKARASVKGTTVDLHSGSSSSSSGSVCSTSSSPSVNPSNLSKDIKNRLCARPNAERGNVKNAQFREPRSYSYRGGTDFLTAENNLDDLTPTSRIRKTNVSHLLNFHFSDSVYNNVTHSYTYSQHSRFSSDHHVYDKYKFLHANCKFVLKEGASVFPKSPDSCVEWEDVIQIQLVCTEVPYCPICLEPPTAPKITKCGHVFCFYCFLHLLDLSENTWAKCPICFDAVKENDLRNVASLENQKFKIGDSITMALLSRKKGTLNVIPKISNYDTQSLVQQLNGSENESYNFAKYYYCKNALEEIQFIHDPILCELKNKVLEAVEDEDEEKYMQMAIEKSEKHVNAIKQLSEPSGAKPDAEPECEGPKNQEEEADAYTYWFYQSKDGQLIFISHFNVKCLIKEYGSMEACPEMLSGQICDLFEARVDEGFRNRHRFLSHLPLTSVVTFVELDLRPPVVSKPTMKFFAEEVRVKKEEKERKRREERKREKRIARETDRLFYPGYTFTDEPETNIDLGEDHFPAFDQSGDGPTNNSGVVFVNEERGSSDEETSLTLDSRDNRASASESHKLSEELDIIPSPTGGSFASFASALRSSAPAVATASANSGPPIQTSLAAATAPKTTPTYAQKMQLVERTEPAPAVFTSSEEYGMELPAPSYTDTFSQAFNRALTLQQDTNDNSNGDKTEKSKKKKKPSKQLLFSNSLQAATFK